MNGYVLKRVNYINALKNKTESTDISVIKDKNGDFCGNIGRFTGIADLPDGTSISEGDGALVAPAFCDLRCNVGEITKKGVSSDILCADRGGYGIICPAPFSGGDYPETPSMYGKYRDKLRSFSNINIVAVSPVTKKHLSSSLCDISGMAKKGAGVFTDVSLGGYIDNHDLFQIMTKIAEVNGVLIASAHDRRLCGGGCVNEGEAAKLTSQTGIPSSAELLAVSRSIILSRQTGCPVHISGISLGESVDMIKRAKETGTKITASCAPPYFYYTEEELLYRGAMAKLMPPLRKEKDSEKLITGLCDGTIDAIESDHVPVFVSAKKNLESAEFGSMSFESAFSAAYTRLVRTGKMSIYRLIDAMSIRPFEIIHRRKFEDGDIARTGLVKLDLKTGGIFSKHNSATVGRVSVFDGAYLYGSVKKIYPPLEK